MKEKILYLNKIIIILGVQIKGRITKSGSYIENNKYLPNHAFKTKIN